MPPKLKTMSSDAIVRLSVAVIRSGLSPRYLHQSSLIPRTRRIPISLAKCFSSRFPRMISSPTTIAPVPTSHPSGLTLDPLATQFADPPEAVLDEGAPAAHPHQ